jgi:serine/threonine protein kinase
MGTEAEAPALPVGPGDVVAGKYAIVRLLGRGGMGSVFEARHRALGQRVAIKMLHAQASGHEEAVERFLREARAAASLTSDHVVRVYDVGIHESGLPFMVMELLEGIDLGELLERRGAIPVGDTVRWVLQAASAVAEAHEAGIVHRDLKPSNLFLVRATTTNRTSKVKVVDFGISKRGNMPEGSVQTLTGPRAVMGSPSYMSPEQVRSTKSVDARTDVWSLGVIMYELLTGRTAFDGESLGDVFAKIREEPLPPIRSVVPAVPASLDSVVSRCLQRDREHRFKDAAELADALRAIALEGTMDEPTPSMGSYFRPTTSSQTTAFDLVPASAAQSTKQPSSSTHAPWISVRTIAPRRRFALAAAIGGACTALVVAAVLVWGGSTTPTAAGSPADAVTESAPPPAQAERPAPAPAPAAEPTPEITPRSTDPTSPLESARPMPRPLVAKPRVPTATPSVTPPKPPVGQPGVRPPGNTGDDLGI